MLSRMEQFDQLRAIINPLLGKKDANGRPLHPYRQILQKAGLPSNHSWEASLSEYALHNGFRRLKTYTRNPQGEISKSSTGRKTNANVAPALIPFQSPIPTKERFIDACLVALQAFVDSYFKED